MEKTYELKFHYVNQNMVLHSILDNLNIIVDDVNYKVMYDQYNLEKIMNFEEYSKSEQNVRVILSTNKKEEDFDHLFLTFYGFINIIIGFFPTLISGITEFELSKKYFSNYMYIRNDSVFLEDDLNIDFTNAYKKYLDILKMSYFQIDYFSYITSINNLYIPEISVVNILQVFDGLYDNLKILKKSSFISQKLSNSKLKKIRKSICTTFEINKNEILKIIDKDYENKSIEYDELFDKLKDDLKNSILKLGNVNFDNKLREIFNYVTQNYEVFNYEKKSEEKYDEFLNKCKKTRNSFSHSFDSDKKFNGFESSMYIFKFVLTFRLLILEEMELTEYISKSKIKKFVDKIDKRLEKGE